MVTLCAGVQSYIYQGRPGGVVEYQYTRKKIDKIPQNTQIPPNIPKNNRIYITLLYIFPSRTIEYATNTYKKYFTLLLQRINCYVIAYFDEKHPS